MDWVEIRPEGLYIVPFDAYIDPIRPVGRALITHGHADHARAGPGEVIATPQTLAILALRYGADFTPCNAPLIMVRHCPNQAGRCLWHLLVMCLVQRRSLLR